MAHPASVDQTRKRIVVKRDTRQPSIEELVLADLGPGRVAAVSGCPF
jgi:hypothetical protein